MLRFVSIVAVIIMCLSASAAMATKLTGKITITAKFREGLAEAEKDTEEGKMRGYWNDPNGIRQVLPPSVNPSTDLGVVIFKDGAKSPGPDKVSSVKVLTGGLERNVLVLRPNSRLKFVMVDPFDHELYSPGVEDFEPQRQAQRSFRPIDFKKEGEFEVRCKLMPHFKAWVVVAPATHVVELKRDGTFKVEGLDDGDYTLKVFFGGKWVAEKKFKVERKQREVELDLKLEDAPKVEKPKAPPAPKGEEKKPESKKEKTDKKKKEAAEESEK